MFGYQVRDLESTLHDIIWAAVLPYQHATTYANKAMLSFIIIFIRIFDICTKSEQHRQSVDMYHRLGMLHGTLRLSPLIPGMLHRTSVCFLFFQPSSTQLIKCGTVIRYPSLTMLDPVFCLGFSRHRYCDHPRPQSQRRVWLQNSLCAQTLCVFLAPYLCGHVCICLDMSGE